MHLSVKTMWLHSFSLDPLNNLRQLALILPLIALLAGCKANDKRATETDAALSSPPLAEQLRFDSSFVVSYNPDSTMLLCEKTTPKTASDPFGSVEFFVFDLSANDTIYKGFQKNGSVAWHDSDHLKLEQTPGMVDGEYDPEAHVLILNPREKTLKKLRKNTVDGIRQK